MSKSPGQLTPEKRESDEFEKQTMATHASSKVLHGQVERGELRTGTPLQKFQAAAKKVAVTNEVLELLQCCQKELRQVQADYKERQRKSNSQIEDKSLPTPAAAAGSKSIKARQNSALAAADDAASYSLRCVERGRVDPAAAAAAATQSSVPQEKSALPADWGFLNGVDKLHAAPAAAAARSHGEVLARPEQQYLSYDSATKAAHQAWQAPEDKDWRKVLTAKKHRAANKSLFEEAEREQAAKFIQAKWLLHKHQKEQQQLKEQQLAAWAAEHYAAAAASRKSLTVKTAQSGSDSETEEGAASDPQGAEYRRRSRVTHEDSVKKPKPIVQPWSRMVGREVPIAALPATPTGAASAAAAAGTPKWRGAVAGAMAANKLSSLASDAAAAAEGDTGSAGQQGGSEVSTGAAAVLMQEVPIIQQVDHDATEPAVLSRTSSSMPPAGRVARTSSVAGALATIKGIFTARTNSSMEGREGADSGGNSNSTSGDGSIAPSKPSMKLTTRLSMDLAAFFGGGHKAKDHSRDNSSSGIRAPHPPEGDSSSSRPPVGLARRISMDISAFFGGGGGHKAKEGSAGESPAGSQGPSRRASKLHMDSNASLGCGGSGASGALLERGGSGVQDSAAASPPLAPRPPPGRRSSVDFVRNLFRRSSVDAPALQQAAELAAGSSDRTAQSSRFVTAESLQQSLVPSPLLSTCATARTSWSDPEGANAGAPSSDLVARGAAAAAAYLEAATKAVADKETVMSLCAYSSGSTAECPAASGSTNPAAPKSSFLTPVSLSGGVGWAGEAGSAQGAANGGSNRGSFDLCSPQAGAGGEDRSSLEQIWSRIQNGTCGTSAASAATSTQQQQQENAAHASSSSKPSEPQPPAKPKVVGVGEVGFAPDKPALVTAADISSSSSSLYKSSGSKSFKGPKPAAAAAADGAAGIAMAASSSFFTPSAPVHPPPSSPSPKPAGATAAAAATAQAAGVAVAESSSFFSSTAAAAAPAAAAPAGRPGSPSPLKLVGTSAAPEGVPSPSSPSRQHVQPALAGLPAWGPGSPPRSPQPPKEPSSSSNSSGRTVRPGSRQNLLARQGGKKSVDMRDDVAAAFAVTSSATTTAAAAAEGGQQGLKAGAAVPVRPASGRSSVSQKLAVARRMAATAGAEEADGDGDSGSPAGLSVQLDGSLKRHIASSSVTRTGKDKGQPDNSPASSSAAAGRPSVLHGSTAQGRKSASLAAAELAPLRPSSGSRTAWVAEPLGKSLKAPTPTAGSTATPGSTVGGKGGRGSTTPTKLLPELGGVRGRSGPVSPVGGFIGGLESAAAAVVDQKPRRNSYSNDGSKPSGGTQGPTGGGLGAGLVVSGGGKLKPSGVGKAARGSIG